ncbi:hypothetical protein [Burkholderia lata]|uniref:hypothetical protein n=1 Tax=Burkholderia lata (strain ATCC 17760 / DSM 23089 / LMG 22485 / NCIMB 9086 / R18194 / 383) TaxID=482957 RepID=UPI001583BB77|nr:hypothetical protein [Burkholderia lata]
MRKHSTLGRRRLTKAQLLPLPADQVRRLSLKHHLALAALSAGRGDVDAIVTLSNVLELSICLGAGDEVESYRHAEAALDQCVARAGRGEPWTLTDVERAALERLAIIHDAQLAVAPAHRYLGALEHVSRKNAANLDLSNLSEE